MGISNNKEGIMFVLVYYLHEDPDLKTAMAEVKQQFCSAKFVSTDLWAIALNLLNCDGGPKILWTKGREPGENIPKGVRVFVNGVEKID